jgi:hypothetical protein
VIGTPRAVNDEDCTVSELVTADHLALKTEGDVAHGGGEATDSADWGSHGVPGAVAVSGSMVLSPWGQSTVLVTWHVRWDVDHSL